VLHRGHHGAPAPGRAAGALQHRHRDAGAAFAAEAGGEARGEAAEEAAAAEDDGGPGVIGYIDPP